MWYELFPNFFNKRCFLQMKRIKIVLFRHCFVDNLRLKKMLRRIIFGIHSECKKMVSLQEVGVFTLHCIGFQCPVFHLT